MQRPRSWLYFNTVGFIITIILNTLANTLPINGKNTGELSDMYPNLFVPAGVTFSIWGILYLLLLGFIIYQWIVVFKSSKDTSFIHKIGPWFFISSLANSSWILAWHYMLPGLSLVIMIVLLVSLIQIYQKLGISGSLHLKAEKYFVHICFSAYLGWITVATIANTTAVLVGLGWNGGDIAPEIWTIIMISIAIGMGVYFAWKNSDFIYALVIVWALYGIFIKRSSLEPVESEIALSAQIGMLILAISIIFSFIKSRLIQKPQ